MVFLVLLKLHHYLRNPTVYLGRPASSMAYGTPNLGKREELRQYQPEAIKQAMVTSRMHPKH